MVAVPARELQQMTVVVVRVVVVARDGRRGKDFKREKLSNAGGAGLLFGERETVEGRKRVEMSE